MKNKVLITILFLAGLLFSSVNAQIKTYIKTIHEEGAQQIFDADRTYDNGVVIIGQAGEGFCGEGLLKKVDSCGELIWAKTFGETGKYSDGGRVVREMPNHTILLGGFVVEGTTEIGALKLVDEFGNQIWSVEFKKIRFITDVNRTANGEILVCGYTHTEKCVYAKLDVTGNLIWSKELDVASTSKRAYNIMELGTGDYILIWNSLSPTADVHVSLMNTLGEIQWTKSYGAGSTFPILREWEPSAIIDPNDGNIVICSGTTSLGQATETNPDILTFKIDLTGNVLWAKTYGSASDDQPKKISYDVQTAGFLISGKTDFDVSSAPTTETLLGHNAMVLSIDNNGQTIRTNIYGGLGEDKVVETVSYDNHYIVAMVCLNSLGAAGYDPFLIKTNNIGEVACQNTTINFPANFETLVENTLPYTELDIDLTFLFGGSAFLDNASTFTNYCQSCDPFFKIIGDPIICLEDSILLVKEDGCSSFFTVNGQVEANDTIVFKYNESGHHIISVEHECVEAPFNYDVYVSVPEAEYSWEDKCLYDSIPFTDQSIVNYGTIEQWEWDFGENNAISNNQNPNFLYQNHGEHDVNLIVTTGEGCTDTIEHTITSHPVPTALLLTKNECLYDSIQFRDSSLINAPSNISSTVLNYGDNNSTTVFNPRYKYTTSGTYLINYAVTTNKGCFDDTSFNIEIHPIPIANFSNTTICENVPPTEFSNLSTVNGGSIIDWHWDFGGNQDNVSGYPNPVHYYLENGEYNVKLVVKTDHECYDTISKIVKVLPAPTNLFTSNITESCNPTCIDFYDYSKSNSTTSNAVIWQWKFSNGESSFEQNPSVCFSNSSNESDSSYSVELITLNELGCYDTLRVEDYVWVWHNPIADFRPAPELVNMYESEVYFQNKSIGADFYNWNFGDTFFGTNFNPTHLFQDTGTFVIELAVETEHACYDTVYHTVRVNPVVSIYIPNSFTPNGDGVNDVFFFKNYGMVEEGMLFRIFDRWGTLIYQTNKFQPWDGTYKGEVVLEDTYVYQLTCFDFFGKETNIKDMLMY